ncbi:MAG TPA: type IV pilin protein [Gemmataceae bacterium]|nr:type IV pilin protein [Gemmataceae bacterium]
MCSRRASRPGFSLVEVVVVITVMAVLISFAMPTFGVAIEQANADIAAANLRAIWTAERLYWLENRTYTTDLSALESAGLLDSAIVTGSSQYAYAVSAADASTFSATATRIASQRWSGAFAIDQTGTVSGSLQAAGQTAIAPGFE